MTERLLTVREVAEKLNISVPSVWRLRSEGVLPEGIKLGQLRRFREAEVDAAIARLSSKNAA